MHASQCMTYRLQCIMYVVLVRSASQLVVQYIAQGSEEVLAEAKRIGQYGPNEAVDDAQKLANRIFATTYMGTVNSSLDTRARWVKGKGTEQRSPCSCCFVSLLFILCL